MNNNGVSRSTSASFKITKRTYINKEGEFQNKEIASRTALPEDDIISEICEVEFQNDTVNGLAVSSYKCRTSFYYSIYSQ